MNVNARLKPTLSFIGFYTANFADGDTGTASNSYNLKQDYGRAAFIRRNMVFVMGNYTGPWGISFNPFLIAQSGRPYNVTTNQDLTGDNFFNDRPAIVGSPSAAPCSTNSPEFVTTSFGCLDVNPQSTDTLLPANIGNSPASVAVNLRVSRSFGIGPKLQSQNGANGGRQGGGGPGGGGPMMGLGGGGPGGGGGGGRGGGGGGFGGPQGANTGHNYSLTFSAQALNLFNDINYGTPSGSINPQQIGTTSEFGPGNRFERSTSLAGGIFASPSGSASRRIFFQAAFNF